MYICVYYASKIKIKTLQTQICNTSPSSIGSLGGWGLIQWGLNPSSERFDNKPTTASPLFPVPSLGCVPGRRSNLLINPHYYKLHSIWFTILSMKTNASQIHLSTAIGPYSDESVSQFGGTSGSGTTFFTKPSLNKWWYGSWWTLSENCCFNWSSGGNSWHHKR